MRTFFITKSLLKEETSFRIHAKQELKYCFKGGKRTLKRKQKERKEEGGRESIKSMKRKRT
jgi:hypothetical protein